MTEVEAVQAILEQWEDGWDALHPLDPDAEGHVPYTYVNETYTTDHLGDLGAWVRVTIQHTTSEQATMGSVGIRKWHRRGNVLVQVFTPIDSGRLLASELADDVRTVLEGYRASDLNLYAGTTGESDEDGAWLMTTVVVPFRYVSTR